MLAAAFRKLLPEAHFLARAALDITDKKQLSRVFAELRPTLLINCAAYTKVDQAEQNQNLAEAVNGRAVGLLAEICRRHRAMMVHFSTDYVFDGTLRRPLCPDDPVGPTSAYGQSKLLGEQLLQAYAPERWLIIRTAWLYGPAGACFPQAILTAARAGKPLVVVADQIGSPTFTHDLAAATLELIRHEAQGIWHVVNDGQASWFDFAAAIVQQFGVQCSLTPTTSAEWKRLRPDSAIRPAYSVLDISPFEKLTGRRTPHWRDALRRYRELVE